MSLDPSYSSYSHTCSLYMCLWVCLWYFCPHFHVFSSERPSDSISNQGPGYDVFLHLCAAVFMSAAISSSFSYFSRCLRDLLHIVAIIALLCGLQRTTWLSGALLVTTFMRGRTVYMHMFQRLNAMLLTMKLDQIILTIIRDLFCFKVPLSKINLTLITRHQEQILIVWTIRDQPINGMKRCMKLFPAPL